MESFLSSTRTGKRKLLSGEREREKRRQKYPRSCIEHKKKKRKEGDQKGGGLPVNLT